MTEKDRSILRSLGEQTAAIAALPEQQKRIANWKKLNSLKLAKPMVMIDQLPWNELDDGSLQCRCEDGFARGIECEMRRALYQWKNFSADMVIEPFIRIGRAYSGNFYEYPVSENTLATDKTNSVVSHEYSDCLASEQDIDKIKLPDIKPDREQDARRLCEYSAVFDGIIPVRLSGYTVHCGIWDRIACARGVSPALYDMYDNPELLKAIVGRFADAAMLLTDQLEAGGLLDASLPLIHCTGAFTDELPMEKGCGAKASEVWGMGLAQMLAVVSPEMYDEFEIQPLKKLLERFGLMYYGCCDPLHNKLHLVRKVKNIRKVSVSPWADEEVSAREMHGDYVFSRKPNPALLAEAFDEAQIRAHLCRSLEICREYATPCELILKDVSTVGGKPERLVKWNEIAQELCGEFSV